MKNKRSLYIAGMVAVLFLVSLAVNVQAREMTIIEAIEWGKENSLELKLKKEEVASLERELKSLLASQEWQLGFSGNTAYNSGPTFSKMVLSLNPEDAAEEGGTFSLGISGSKSFPSGLKITTNYILSETSPFQFDNLEDKSSFSLEVSRRLYPLVPTEIEKQLMQVENNLLIAKAELLQKTHQKEIDWIEGFLNLAILQSREKVAEAGYQVAREELERVKSLQAIGETGEEQVLIAEISLQEALLSLEQARNGIQKATKKLYLDLGLPVDSGIQVSLSEEYFKGLNERAKIGIASTNEERLLELLKENNPGLNKLRLEMEDARKNLEWGQQEGKVKITAVGSYEQNYLSKKADWSIGLTLSYDLLDGGQRENLLEGLQSALELREQQYQNHLENLKMELQSLVEGIELAAKNLKISELAAEKAKLEMRLYQQQYEKGLISEVDFKQQELRNRQLEIDYQEAWNELLVSRLRLLNFLGLYSK